MSYFSFLLFVLAACTSSASNIDIPSKDMQQRRLSTDVDKDEILLEHNIARCMHDTTPLKWKKKLAKKSQKYANYLAENMCGNLKHSSGENYGETLYTCGAYGGDVDPESPCYTAEKVMTGWYTDEVSYLGGHMTQVVWASTKKVGCARQTCMDGRYHTDVIVCQYKKRGNNGDMSNVKPKNSKTKEECKAMLT